MKTLEDGKLDIMLYDASDWAGEQLRFSWITGGAFYKMFRGVEHHSGFHSWEEALRWVLEVEPEKKINSLQFWGHGSPGRVWINGDFLSARSLLASSTHRELLLKLKNRLTNESLVWFRCCNLFAGREGQLFANTFSKFMDCTIASHTYIIGPWQSGLHTIKPDQQPYWPVDEGFGSDNEKLWSMPWSPNTIFCLTGKIPEGW